MLRKIKDATWYNLKVSKWIFIRLYVQIQNFNFLFYIGIYQYLAETLIYFETKTLT